MKTIGLSLLLLLPGFATAQNNNQAAKDSLRKAVIVQEGGEKLITLQRLAIIYYGEARDKQGIDSLIAVYDELDREAKKQGNLKQQGALRVNILSAMRNVHMLDEIIKRAPEYLNFLKENEVWEYYFHVGGVLLQSYTDNGEPEKALAEAQRFYAEAQKLQNKQGIASILYAMSTIYGSQRRFEESVEHSRKVIELLQGEDKLLSLLSNAYDHLCSSLLLLNRYDEVLTCLVEFENINKRYAAYMKAPIPTAWGNLWSKYASLYLKTGEYDKAEIYCNRMDSAITSPVYRKLSYRYRTDILIARKQYSEALEMNDKAMELATNPTNINGVRGMRIEILAKMGRGEEALKLFKVAAAVDDSIRNLQFNAQLDEFRTQYEVDKHIAEKEKTRNYLLFAIAGCFLLSLALGIWIYLHHQIVQKNYFLYRQVQDLMQKEKEAEQQLFNVPEEELSRAMQLFRQLSEHMHKEKLFTEPDLSRKKLANRLHTNERYLANAIREATGETFSAYLANLRLQYALTLLEETSGLPIDALAIDSGHGSYASFLRLFTKKYGITPSEYRKLATEKNLKKNLSID